MVIRKILQSGHLDVGDGHKLYFELCGNSKGKLMVTNKGGPGGTFKDTDKQIYNLKKYQVLFYDQRGCGRSTFKQLLKHNTTQHLVSDVKKLIEHVGQKDAIVVGTSWGSTVSLLFAITYPQMTKELRIGGVFLGTKKECDMRNQLKTYYPHAYKEIVRLYGTNYLQTLFNLVLKKRDAQAAKYLALCEYALMSYIFDWEKAKKEPFEFDNSNSIFSHYFKNACFLKPNYILKNLKNIKHIKTSIVQGTHDLVCVPAVAQSVADKLDNCKMRFVIGGHYEDKKDVTSQLKNAIIKEYAR